MSDHLFDLTLGLSRAEGASLIQAAQKYQFLRRAAKPAHMFSTTVYLESEGVEHEIEGGINYSAIYEPAKLYGAYEDCYPDSSEMDIDELVMLDTLPEGVTQAMVNVAAEYQMERIEAECWEHYENEMEDEYHD